MPIPGWIVRGKLRPPAPGPTWLSRSLGGGDPLAPAVLLEAGPGWGKTHALASLLARAVPGEGIGQWYGLDPDDADPSILFHHLLAGLRGHIPAFGADLEALLGSGAEPRALWQAFFAAVESYNLPAFALALDDVHHLATSPGALKALVYFLDKLPVGHHVLLSSRERLDVPTSRLEARGQLAVWREERLRFTDVEREALFGGRAGEAGVPAAWRHLAADMEGWPLGLDVVSLTREGMGGRAASGPVAAYLAEEVVRAQPARRQDFMRRAALLDDLTVEACAAIFEVADAATELAALEAAHLVWPVAGSGYRFPAYLLGHLRADSGVPVADRRTWHQRAAAFYLAERRVEAAIPHLFAAGDWPGARDACGACFPTMRFDGRQGQIRRWLAAFPEAFAAGDPLLALWQGHVLAYRGESREARPAYERARKGFLATEDLAGAFAALVAACNTALTLGDEEAFANWLAVSKVVEPGSVRPADLADLRLIEAYDGERRGDMAAMRAANDAALAIAIDGEIEVAASHCIALSNLGTHALYRGEFDAAQAAFARVVDLAATWRLAAYGLAARFLEAHITLVRGQVAEAGVILAAVPAIWPDLLDYHDRAVAWTVVGFHHEAGGAWRDAEGAYRKAMAIFDEAGFADGRAVPLERLLWLAIARDQPERVAGLWAEAPPRQPGALHHLALDLPCARAALAQGFYAIALEGVRGTMPELERLGAAWHLARARLYEAAALLGTGEAAEAARSYGLALGTMRAHDLGFLADQDAALWAMLRPLQDQLSLLAPAPAEPTAEEGPPRLAIRCLGGLTVRRGGRVVDQWPRRKAQLLLAALVLNRDGLRALDLAEVIGAEDGGDPLNVLRVNAHALRRALEPDLGRGAASAYVRHADDMYGLVWEAVADVDVYAFIAALREADQLDAAGDPAGATRARERAMGLYKGNLLDDAVCRDFFDVEREHHRALAVAALLRLAATQDDLAIAETWLRRAAELAPVDEAVTVALLDHFGRGALPEAVRQVYWDARKAHHQQLGQVPGLKVEKAFKAALASAEAASPVAG